MKPPSWEDRDMNRPWVEMRYGKVVASGPKGKAKKIKRKKNAGRDLISSSAWGLFDYGDAPACPRCGDKMAVRSGRNGRFWGCSAFPDCRGVRAYR